MLPIIDETQRRGRNSYGEGIAARNLGVGLRACPYPPGTVRQIDWLTGWYDEDRSIADREAKPASRSGLAA